MTEDVARRTVADCFWLQNGHANDGRCKASARGEVRCVPPAEADRGARRAGEHAP
jgi:hypothetical protein